MDIQSTPYKEIALKMYPHYLEREHEQRNKALILLEAGKLKDLEKIIQYCIKQHNESALVSNKISKVIIELKNFKLPENSSDPTLAAYSIDNDQEPKILIEFYTYSVRNDERCTSLAKHYSRSDAWKIKHQPNGKDAKIALKILNKFI